MLRRTRFAAPAAACCLAAAIALAQPGSFTLEQVMSAPFPTGLTAAPAGGALAWVFNARGVRNIWVATPPDYKALALTHYRDDDGQDIGELSWSSDGRLIAYTRGGDFENEGSYPNPAAFPQGVEQDVWVISLDGGPPRKVGEGHQPAFSRAGSGKASPNDAKLAFIDKEQVWLAGLTGGAKPAQLIHDEGKCRSLRWSPDGSKLALVSERREHQLIGVYDFAARSLHYLDPSVDYDFGPVWSPDGREIAFIRIPASGEAFAFGPKREGSPWSIRVADAVTGSGREVWKAQAGQGSVFRGITANDPLLWGAGSRIVFPWEADGWTHLYSIPVAGGRAALMTPGDFDVEEVSIGPDRKEVLFNSNQGDTDRRHLWRAAVDGAPPVELTQGDGIEWSPVMASDGRTLALLHSDAHWPARPAILGPASAKSEIRDIAAQAIPADFPGARLVAPQQVLLAAADGLEIHGQLFLPPRAAPGVKHPAIVFLHGGSRRQMLLGWHSMGYYSNAYALNQYLASRGYIVLSVNYRSGIGYGMKFREALNYGATGASEFNDVLGAGLYLRSRPDVEPKRIGLWGGSYGGYLTALGLARASDLFAAGVDLHGVHDWNLEIPNFAPAYNPEKQQAAARLAWESSPLASVNTWRSPVLLVQGDDDRNVPFTETIHLVEALRRQGVDFQLLVLPDEIHDFLLHRSWLKAYHAASDFFDLKLGTGNGQ